MQASKWRELLEELRTVFTGHNSFFDAILPPIIFLLINGLVSFQAAMWSALILAIGIASLRVIRKQSLIYALAGVVQKEGLMADIKKKVFYEKPSVKMKTKQRQAQKKRMKTARLKRQVKKD